MSEPPLFYRHVTALDRDLHAEIRLAPPTYGFARGTHLVPAVADEFAAACRDLPILFAPAGLVPAPVFLVGTRPGENLLVGPDGAWRGTYVPAYLRRYPFIRGEVGDGEPIVLFATGTELLGPEGEALFAAGEPTALLRERVDLVDGYAEAARRTETLSRMLLVLGLFRDVAVPFRTADGDERTLGGLFAVDEAKLNALPDADFLLFRAYGYLAAIHAHLVSLTALDALDRWASFG